MNVVLTFYRNFIWPLTFITLISCYILLDGSAREVVYLFWMKIITSLFIGLYFEIFHSKQFYFFLQFGLFQNSAIYKCCDS